MSDFIEQPLARITEGLLKREISSAELVDEALSRHERRGTGLHAYKHLDALAAKSAAHPRRLEPAIIIPTNVRGLGV